jgi:hypothetical protein
MSFAIATISILSFFVGQWLVTKRNCTGFFIWGLSNLMVAAEKFACGDSSTACMFLIYFLANAYSLMNWAKAKA